jgi:hypothetical protein
VPEREREEMYEDAEEETVDKVSAVPLRDRPGTSVEDGGEAEVGYRDLDRSLEWTLAE